AQSTKYSKETLERIDQVEKHLSGPIITSNDKFWTIADRMDFYKNPSVSIAVIKDFKIDWIKAYGYADRTEKIPATTQTLYQAASNGKSLNAMGILKLAQDNKIDLYTDINKYLSTWKFPYDS